MMLSLSDFYKDKIAFYQKKIRATKQRVNVYSVFRLIVFIVIALAVYAEIQDYTLSLLLIIIFLACLFAVLVFASSGLKKQVSLFDKMIFINENELDMLSNKPNRFNDGKSFMSAGLYTDDLDVFGEGSVFQLLNRTTTSHGMTRLAVLLSGPFTTKQDIGEAQQAVQQLSSQPDRQQSIIASGLLHKEHSGNLHSVKEWLQTESVLIRQKWLLIIRWLLPLYNCFFFLFYLSTDHVAPLLAGIGVSLMLNGKYIRFVNQQHRLISKKQEILDQYAAVLQACSAVDAGSSVKLQRIKAVAAQAFSAMIKLSRLSSSFDQRTNLLVLLFINPLFAYDMQCLLELEKWKEEHKDHFSDWIGCVGDIEYLNSLACFAFNHQGYVYPIISSDGMFIEGKNLAHPLIPGKESVPNDFSIGKGNTLQLITGSNMSGKTTFLRTIGVNLLLAQCGCPVCATSFSFTPMDILSSIRVSDSLQEHTSYFMAELKRLQKIVDRLEQGNPALVLIDEILRGTNSEDKTHGSEQFIRKLLQYRCVSLFATHDLSLSVLEQEFHGAVCNYCFESTITDDELHFDYTLKEGVAKNRNASFLMKKMNIIQ